MHQRERIRLTQYCQAAGCAAKLPPGELEQVLDGLSPADADRFESGIGRRDDAGWIEFGGSILLQSVDFFTPVVDDPYRFGAIAAANAMSDIYAMGGEPLTALNLAGFPEELDLEVLQQILAGGGDKITESGAVLCGGHSVRDSEPKYGLAVTGFVSHDRLVRNGGALAGDRLVLTKPLGVGILTTALKRDLIDEPAAQDVFDAMTRLNRGARDAMLEVGVSAATDVTGYGLLGHLMEMVGQDGGGAVIDRASVPVWRPADRLAADGCYPGGLERNRAYLGHDVTADGVAGHDLLPLFDPQTSGGLLIAVHPDRLVRLTEQLERRGELAAVIGEVTGQPGLRIRA